jgi:hypothetical protein
MAPGGPGGIDIGIAASVPLARFLFDATTCPACDIRHDTVFTVSSRVRFRRMRHPSPFNSLRGRPAVAMLVRTVGMPAPRHGRKLG